MEISNIEKVCSYYNSICESLPIGSFGIKVLHDALLELAVLKASGAPAEQQATKQGSEPSEISALLYKINIEVTATLGEGRVLNLVREAQKLLPC